MFNNVGAKIKLFSKILCYVLIPIILIGSIIIAITSEGLVYENGVFTPQKYLSSWRVGSDISPVMVVVYGIALSIGVYFSSLLTYGFGQLIENITTKKDGET